MSEPSPVCPFCEFPLSHRWLVNSSAMALKDAFPVSKGHTLVVPLRHTVSIFSLPSDELRGLAAMVVQVRRRLAQELAPDAFNIGINDGEAAGQTVLHAHVHVIPRFHGDVEDPRGGVRWVVPERARYWEAL